MVRTVVAPLLVLLVHAAAHGQSNRDRLSLVLQGEEALQRQEIPNAIAAFREAAGDSNPARRAAGERMLGVIEWRFFRHNGLAREHFGAALATHYDTSATLVELARLAIAEGRYRQAARLAASARDAAPNEFDRRSSVLQLGRAVSEAALAARTEGDPAEAPDDSLAARAVAELSALVSETPGRAEESRQLLLAALVAGDGNAAARAVHSYYLIDVGPGMRSVVAAPVAELARLLPSWQAGAPRAERQRLAALLVAARFPDAAALVAPDGDEAVAYEAFCRRLARDAEEYYRRSLLGEARPDELTRAYMRASHDLWPRLRWRGAPPPFYPAASDRELARRFGTVFQLGITGGFYDMHVGHVVAMEHRVVRQYGRRANVTFLVLDGMVTNGLQSWAWDEAGGHGGWQRGDTVMQVRPIFVEHALALWVSADSARRERETRVIAIDSTLDLRAAARDSVAYLPSVAARLRRDGRAALLDSLRRAGVPDSAMESTFVRVMTQLYRESSILAHEGRHAIDDDAFPRLRPDEREFRAKLSEVAFADRPKLVMSSIIHPNIGDATPHGRANARVMLGLLRWMRAHAREIPGLDATQPLMPQLPLLTAAQLRAAFRSMDPLAPVSS